ncbi:MAG: hypothetical protein AAGD04_16780 [Pseudomonadota bacterium]
MRNYRVWIVILLGLMGCAVPLNEDGKTDPTSEPVEKTLAPAPPPPAQTAVTAEQFDTTTPEQRAAVVVAPKAEQPDTGLGKTVVSLGSPADPGFWLATPLVSSKRAGRVTVPGGASAEVELRPIDGPATAGSRLSLPAMRVLKLPLTGLTEVEVYEIEGA